MASIDFAGLGAPVSEAEPCGPDLDLAGDMDYMNFVARAEGVLPATFFSGPEGKPFDRSSIDFDAEFATFDQLLARTRDIRLLTLLAKFLILSRDLAGFTACVALIDRLIKDHWDEVHPQAFDGDFGIRVAALESLDDMPVVVFPLQYLPLTVHRRMGPISYRSWMIATGEAKPREGEELLDRAAIESALAEEELSALVERRGQFHTLQSAFASIRESCVDRIGANRAAKLEKTPALTDKITDLLETAVAKRDPSLATAAPHSEAGAANGAAAASTIPAGAIASMQDVANALRAITTYFARHEPSSPALLLVRQAEQLMGKSFLEAMRVLVPNYMDQAAIHIGKDQMFDLPLERLSAFSDIAAEYSDTSEATRPDDAAEPAEDGANGAAAASPMVEARTRADAIRLLDQIGVYYRVAEPSSPVPFLTDRARSFAERDFLSLLKELLPGEALKGPPGT
jgi:type VI secretion system protein ImpA